MENMMNGNGMMVWGMGAICLLVVILIVLAIVALMKYLFAGGRQ
jgi:hypothetical protein